MSKDLPRKGLEAVRKVARFLKEKVPSSEWKPVRKIVAVALAGVVVAVAHTLGVDLGAEAVNRIVDLIIVTGTGYLVRS
jgi:hypothetical protein